MCKDGHHLVVSGEEVGHNQVAGFPVDVAEGRYGCVDRPSGYTWIRILVQHGCIDYHSSFELVFSELTCMVAEQNLRLLGIPYGSLSGVAMVESLRARDIVIT